MIADRRIRVVHYTRPCYLDHSLSLVRALSKLAEVHLLIELSPESRRGSMFGEDRLDDMPGVHSASAALRSGFLAETPSFLSDLASTRLVVHRDRRAFAPGSLRTGWAAAAHVRKLRPDVLHVEEESSRALPLFFCTPGTPKLLAIHDVNPHPGESVGRRSLARRLALPRASQLLFYSRYSHDQFARDWPSGPTPHAIVPLGVKEVFREWPASSPPERAGTLLFFGRIAPYKGLDVLFQALPEIAARVPHLRVVVAGRPAPHYPMPTLPSLPANVEVVMHLETVDNATTRRLFAEASVVVLPYVEASQSGVVQTAYAFGKPVVASAIGGLAEVVRDGVTGYLVPPGAPRPLAKAVADLLTNAEARAAMRLAIGNHEATEFGWDPIAQQLYALYAAMSGVGTKPGRAMSRDARTRLADYESHETPAGV
ncbi:MAG: glycosyltransferase family 4 protein [Chloroflexi bacterium]|nr:glycosyltransferase family 4 protein [Chloroflexota bacterium]